MIDAVKTEPLFRGTWADHYDDLIDTYGALDFTSNNVLDLDESVYEEEGCAVCAVGGTLRKAGIKDINDIDVCAWDIVGEYSVKGTTAIPGLLKKGLYFNALSCFFESGKWKTRQDLVDWIEANVPEDFETQIDYEVE